MSKATREDMLILDAAKRVDRCVKGGLSLPDFRMVQGTAAALIREAEARGRELERKENRDLERLARLRSHPAAVMGAMLESLASTRENCVAEVAYCESRCEDDVIATSRACLELVDTLIALLQGDP